MSAVLEFGFSAGSVFSGLDRLEKRLDGLNDKVTRFSGFDLGGLLGGATIAGAAVYLKNTANELSALVDSADRLRSTPETIQRVTKAAEILGGTDLETLATGLEKLTRELIENPDSGLAKSLADLGFSSQAFLSADLDEKLLLVADAFGEAQRRGTALPLLTEALGKGFSKMIPTLQTGREELRKFFDSTAVIGNQAVLKVDAINDRFDIMAGKLATAGKVLALGLAQGLAEMTGVMPRTQINPDGGAADNAAIEAAAKEKRAAEASAALKEQARKKSEEAAKAQKKVFDDEWEQLGKNLDATARLAEEKRRAALDEMSVGKRIATLHVQLNDALEWEKALRADFVPDAEKILTAESRTLQIQRELARATKDYRREKEQAAEAAKRDAEESARANEQRRNAVLSMAQEYRLLEARASGRKRAIEDAERENAIEQRRDRLIKENGLSFDEATRLSQKMRDMEEQADNGGRSPRIRGVRRRRFMGGLSEFYADQRGPSDLERLQQTESAFDRLQRTPSAFDQLQRRAAAGRTGQQNAQNARDPAPPRVTSPDDAINKILQLLPKGIADALLNN